MSTGPMILKDEIETTFDFKTLAATIGGISFDDYFTIHKADIETFEQVKKLARVIKDYIGFDIRRRQAIENSVHTPKGKAAMEKILKYAEGL